jgi:hypothetical protein
MENPHEMQPLGTFEPSEAKRMLPLLEAHSIAFEIDADDSAMTVPGREVEMFMGMYPRGSQVEIRVPASSLQAGLELVQSLYPAENPPPPESGGWISRLTPRSTE